MNTHYNLSAPTEGAMLQANGSEHLTARQQREKIRKEKRAKEAAQFTMASMLVKQALRDHAIRSYYDNISRRQGLLTPYIAAMTEYLNTGSLMYGKGCYRGSVSNPGERM
jgi:hypothetical protein